MTAFDYLYQALNQLSKQHQYRHLNAESGIDFTSNDYLGLKNHPTLTHIAIEALQAGLPVGAGASRLLGGNHDAIEQLEHNAAQHFQSESALFVQSGFIANYLLMTTLPNRHDVVIFDSEIHASLKDGIHASHARAFKVSHNDCDAYETALKEAHSKNPRQIWIVIESIYSMSGDRALLTELDALAEKYDAVIIVDEAHATGTFGEKGIGLSYLIQRSPTIAVRTCGKALGSSGALICAPKIVVDYLINHARPFIYSTAPLPLNALIVNAAIILQSQESWRQKQLHTHMKNLGKALNKIISTPIIPIVIGDNAATLHAATQLQKQGLNIRAIRPPTVAEGAAQLRITIHAQHTVDDINLLIQALKTL